jgi:hypothetical protein
MWLATAPLTCSQNQQALNRSTSASSTLRINGSTIICAPPM